jgi:hypothetical protein
MNRASLVEAGVARGDLEPAALGHGVARVGREIGDRRLKLRRIGDDRPKIARRIDRNLDILAKRAGQKLGEVGNQIVDFDPLRLQRLAAREGEESPSEIGATEPRLQRVAREFLDFPAVNEIAQQIEITDDDSELIVEIVRNPACKIADRLHLLRLAQLGLDRPPLRRVVVSRTTASTTSWLPIDAD